MKWVDYNNDLLKQCPDFWEVDVVSDGAKFNCRMRLKNVLPYKTGDIAKLRAGLVRLFTDDGYEIEDITFDNDGDSHITLKNGHVVHGWDVFYVVWTKVLKNADSIAITSMSNGKIALTNDYDSVEVCFIDGKFVVYNATCPIIVDND